MMADSTAHSTSKRPKTTAQKHGRSRNHYTTVKMAPCKICGGTSTGYHFGVVSCEACKAFFRRAIAKESYSQYVCQKGKDCSRFPRKINSCCACRFKRCLEYGMSKDGVRRGRYSIELRTKSILDAQRVEDERLKERTTQKRELTSNFEELSSQPNCKNRRQPNENTPHIEHEAQILYSDYAPSPKQFPWREKSDFFKVFLDTHASRDIGLDNMTDQDYSLMKAVCEGYSFCQSSDCVSLSGDEMLQYVHTSPESRPPSNCSSEVLHSMELMTDETIEELDSVIDLEKDMDRRDRSKAPYPVVSSEDERRMDRLIQKLVELQGALYPHHKVTEDILQKQKIIEKQHQQREEAFLCMFGSAEYASSNDFKDVLSEINIELDDRLIRFREKARATEMSIVLYVYYSKFIPGFKHLDKEDVSNILKASYSEFWLFSNFATINGQTGVSGGTDVVLNGHKKVIKTFFPKDYVDDIFAFAVTLQKLELTVEEVSLIRVIILTLIDKCPSPLKEPEKVETLNQLFVRCLQYYINKSSPEPRSRFYKILDRLIAVRTLMHRNKKVNETFLKEWGFLMADFPLWQEMMLSQLPHLQKKTGSPEYTG